MPIISFNIRRCSRADSPSGFSILDNRKHKMQNVLIGAEEGKERKNRKRSKFESQKEKLREKRTKRVIEATYTHKWRKRRGKEPTRPGGVCRRKGPKIEKAIKKGKKQKMGNRETRCGIRNKRIKRGKDTKTQTSRCYLYQQCTRRFCFLAASPPCSVSRTSYFLVLCSVFCTPFSIFPYIQPHVVLR